jgi:hypothetical protein
VRRILALVGAIAALAAGVTAAVALGAGTSSPDTSTGTTTAVAAGATTTTGPDTATGTTTTTTTPETATGTTTAVAAGATTTTGPDTATGTTTAVAAGATTNTASSKVWVCHHTGSWKYPYHLIDISTHALPAHMRHGDVTPGTDNSCPTTQPAGTKTHGRGNGQSNNAKTKDHAGKGADKTETNDD